MRNLRNKCLGGVAVMSLLACTNFVQASGLSPQITLHHAQVSSNKVNVDLGMQSLSTDVVALEVSLIADDIQGILNADSRIGNSYTTYQLETLGDGKEKLTTYIVSEDRETPLRVSELVHFNLQTGGKLTIDENNISIKLIEKGYITKAYENAKLIYTEGEYKPEHIDEGNSGNAGGSGVNDSDDEDTNSTGSSSGNSSTNSGSQNGNNNGSVNVENSTDNNNSGNNSANVSFTDLEKHWAKSAIVNMANKGVIKGYADGSFKPSASITRGEFATLLARAFEVEKISNDNPFKDVAGDKWYTDSIVALYHAGITSGRVDGSFGVNAPITNEEISTMLYRMLNVKGMSLTEINPQGIRFTDEQAISSYAKEPVQALVKMGLINGKPDGSFGPKAVTSRAQVAVILDRIFTLIK